MARQTVRVHGLKELDKALGELPKSTGKAVLRRVLRKNAEPVAEAARPLTRVKEGDLRASIGVGTKLTRRQSKLHRRLFRNDKASAEMFVGAGGLPQAITEEFGTIDQAPHPFMRPAWDAQKHRVLDGIKNDLWTEIDRAAKRLARKRAREAAKAQ